MSTRLRLVLGGAALLVVAAVGAASWLLTPDSPSAADAALLGAIEQDEAADLVPAGTSLVEAYSVAPCTDSDTSGRVVRVFDSSVPTARVFKEVQESLENGGWQLMSTAIAPDSEFGGEALYGKTIGGTEAELRVLSLIEDTPYTDQYGRPSDYNLEINISVEPPAC